MPKYYVAGIPFDSEDCLKHYGVPGMKWNQHIFGIDANDKYINWLKDAGQNIGKFVNKAANTVGNAATSAARAAGGALNKSANFVTGNQARENLNTAKANATNTQAGRSKVNDAYARYDQLRNSEAQHRTAANGWRESQANRAPLENFGRTQDRINADNEDRRANQDANRAEIAKMKADRMAERQRNAETQARAEVKNAQQAYDRTLPGAAENAARGAQGFLNSAGKWVSTAANDAKNWAGNAINDAGNAIDEAYRNSGAKGLVDDIENRITGSIDRNTAEGLRQLADHQEDPNASFHSPMPQYSPDNLRKEADEYQQKADNSLFGRIGNAANAVGNWVGGAYNDAKEWAGNAVNDVGNAANQAGQWLGDRAQDVGKVATDAWNGVSGAASQAGDWIGDRGREAGETIGNATKDAREWAGNAANEVGKAAGSAVNAVGNAANDAGQWIGDRARETGTALGNVAESVQDWATNAVDDITGKNRARENHSNQMRDYASEVIDPSYSSRDREKILRDMISAEDDAISKGVANDRFFDGNVGGAIRNNLDMIDYIMNQLPNTPSSGQDKLYEYIEDLRNQNQMYLEAILGSKYPDGVRIRHSDISDKPEGVGEAFWKNYIAHGGTREDYERDWR